MALTLRRPPLRRHALSVVSMIDVMMILLFFFMITSSYLNLNMVPALQKSAAAPAVAGSAAPSATLLIRIDAEGHAQIAGQVLGTDALTTLIRSHVASDPLTPVLLFPSGAANLQALITVMDVVTRAGATRVKVIRVEAQP